MERMDSVREEEDVTEDLTSELSNLAPVAKKRLELSSARLDSRDSRYAAAMPHPSASVSPPTSPQIQTSPRSQTSPTRNTGTVKRTGLSLFPSPPGSTGSRSSGRASTDLPSVVVQRPTVKRNASTPPPQAPADILRPSSPFQPRPNSPSFFSKRSTTPTAPSMSSPAPHFQTLSRSIHTTQLSYNPAANSSLLNSEDDPDAFSGQLKLHTSLMFNA
ncbi:hypothetical protein BDR26DRAFT_70347 [Obelidium mucronatum]|nr:hypothetical protein BDR26DRAFT_70347 [Obelidium mucronatum]